MIPVRDINPRVRVPFVNYALIGLTVAAFVWELGLGSEVDGFIRTYGFVPSRFTEVAASRDPVAIRGELISVLISMFLHGGWFHIIGNLLYLRVFGDNVEDRFGHVLYLLFYLASGAAGVLGQLMVDPESTVPMVGASGAIAGVLGAYIVMFPRAKIVTLFPIVVFLTFIEVPAVIFLGIWVVQQLLNGYLSLSIEVQGGGVAWFAHLGGFALGVPCGLAGRLIHARRRRLRPRRASSISGAR